MLFLCSCCCCLCCWRFFFVIWQILCELKCKKCKLMQTFFVVHFLFVCLFAFCQSKTKRWGENILQTKKKQKLRKKLVALLFIQSVLKMSLNEKESRQKTMTTLQRGNFMSFYFDLIMNKYILNKQRNSIANQMTAMKGNSSFYRIFAISYTNAMRQAFVKTICSRLCCTSFLWLEKSNHLIFATTTIWFR